MTIPRAAAHVLIVEDRDSLRTMLRHAMEAQGHRVTEARDQDEAEQALRQTEVSLVLTDLRLPVGDGLGVLGAAQDLDSTLPVVVMTAYGGVPEAVDAMKRGALDFLAKPVDPDHLALIVERALAVRRLVTENLRLREELATRKGAPEIIGDAPALRKVLLTLQRAATTDMTVLLEGESGTGKELFARSVHSMSRRAEGPFVAINCAAIPETLIESELFGHEKGAFTGAVGRKLGKFEVAHHGTLFLDEIGDLPLALQAKILRALEHRQFERVGGNASVHVDVRVVAATNHDLKAAIAARRFREDLYFRLSVLPITVPPLRERGDDVLRLAQHFIGRFCRELGRPLFRLGDDAAEAMQVYHWPGNVRELQNCIERAVILADGDTLHARHLNLSFAAGPGRAEPPVDPWAVVDLSGTLADVLRRAQREVEQRKIVQALDECGGDRGRAADVLQIPMRMLLAKLRDYGLDR